MYKLCITFFLFQLCFFVKAQNISGRVLDVNKKPIEGVHVYLDNTSIVTLTNTNGNFILQNPKKINSNIVFRLMGYQTIISTPKQQMIVILEEDVSELEELVIKKSKFSRAQLLKVFKEQFLGTTEYGKACKILNEDDLELSYNPDTFVLETSSNTPIKIYNPLLGYNIEFYLKESRTHFKSYSIEDSQINQNLFIGSTLFKEAQFVSDVALKNRKNVYKGSIQHFFSTLVDPNKKMDDYKANIQDIKNSFFIENLNDNNYLVTPKFNKDKTINDSIIKNDKINIYYKIEYNKLRSVINLKSNQFVIDKNGNYAPIQSVVLDGEMSKHRLGNMLPLNFEFKE